MPGYYIHLAGVNKKLRNNRDFIIGVEAPDLLKKYYNLYGLDGARDKYNSIKTMAMPDFSKFEERVQQVENSLNNNGMHYGTSSNPDIWYYWNSLDAREQINPFFIGYLWHLLEDLLIYKYLDIDKKSKLLMERFKDAKDFKELMKIERDNLHKDWDKTNAMVRKEYPDVVLTPEVIELDVIHFIDCEQTKYIDWNIIKIIIDYFRLVNPLEDNIINIINDIMFLLPDSNDLSSDGLSKKIVLKTYRRQIDSLYN